MLHTKDQQLHQGERKLHRLLNKLDKFCIKRNSTNFKNCIFISLDVTAQCSYEFMCAKSLFEPCGPCSQRPTFHHCSP